MGTRRATAGGAPRGGSRFPALKRRLPLAASLFLALSVLVWWHTWSTHPAGVTTCGCGDAALSMWFLEWPAWALAHGHTPWFSRAMSYPHGVNLLANTGMLAIGIPLAPVTWLFGPVATLNVAEALAPALTATAMYTFVRRRVSFEPARIAAGLLYGFSPFLLVNDAIAHVDLAMLPVPPLVALLLADLLVDRRHSAWWDGVALGLLATIQFFLSAEILLIMAFSAVVALVAVGVAGIASAIRGSQALRAGLARAAAGIGTAVGVASAALVVPVLYSLSGPAHLSGSVWPDVQALDQYTLSNLVLPASAGGEQHGVQLSGYLGRLLPPEVYLGAGLLAVALFAVVVWRHDGWLRLWAFLALVTGLLALGVGGGQPAPWAWFQHLPLLQNVIQDRFVSVTTMALATVAAGAADRTVTALGSRGARGAGGGGGGGGGCGGGGGRRGAARRALAATGGLAVLCLAVGPVAGALLPVLPFETTQVLVPTWFKSPARHLPSGQVLLVYPPAFSGVQSAMAWQAVDRMSFTMVGAGGPDSVLARAGPERAGQVVLSWLSFGLDPTPKVSENQFRAVRSALEEWGVTKVVIPQQVGPPVVGEGRSAPLASTFMTVALGRLPEFESGAWIWSGDIYAGHVLDVSYRTVALCSLAGSKSGAPPLSGPSCVLHASRH